MLMDRSERAVRSIRPRLVQRQHPAGETLGNTVARSGSAYMVRRRKFERRNLVT